MLIRHSPKLVFDPVWLNLLMYKVTPNSYFSALDLTGPDASKTLQGQLTNDVVNQRDQSGMKGLLCNIKGRVELVVRVYKHSAEHLTLVVPRANTDLVKRRLAPYMAFSKSQLNECDLSDYSLLFGPATADAKETLAGLSFDGLALLSPQELLNTTVPLTHSSIEDFHTYRVKRGMLELDPEQSGLYTPQALSLDRLGYVSFKKGCYMGQEIIARLHYKGQSKYQLAVLQCLSAVANETKVTSPAGATLGTIVDSAANASGHYLASIRLAEDATAEYFVNDHPATLLQLFGN